MQIKYIDKFKYNRSSRYFSGCYMFPHTIGFSLGSSRELALLHAAVSWQQPAPPNTFVFNFF